jgi:hypothetical protein
MTEAGPRIPEPRSQPEGAPVIATAISEKTGRASRPPFVPDGGLPEPHPGPLTILRAKDNASGRCLGTLGLRYSRQPVSQADDENQLCRIPVPARDHSPSNVVLPPIHPEPSRRRWARPPHHTGDAWPPSRDAFGLARCPTCRSRAAPCPGRAATGRLQQTTQHFAARRVHVERQRDDAIDHDMGGQIALADAGFAGRRQHRMHLADGERPGDDAHTDQISNPTALVEPPHLCAIPPAS